MVTNVHEEVLQFWLGEDPDDPATVQRKREMWFAGGDEIDREILSRFGGVLDGIVAGSLAPSEEGPRGRLAAIIVLDQFSRNVHRGTARAFGQDPLAQRLALEGLERQQDLGLAIMARVFFYFPLHHAEDLALQRRMVSLLNGLLDVAPPHLHGIVSGNLEYAKEHCGVIERFGRFPHRNEVLGRASTAEEREYLAAGGNRYGQ